MTERRENGTVVILDEAVRARLQDVNPRERSRLWARWREVAAVGQRGRTAGTQATLWGRE